MKLYCLSGDPNKPCSILQFKGITFMLDCGLSSLSVLNFLPLPFVRSARLDNLPGWVPRDASDPELEKELKECCGRVFVDSPPEFLPPQSKVVDFSQVDVILISNYLCMLALPFITEGTGFTGKVYATEPTMQIGRMFLEELVDNIEQMPKSSTASHWKEFLHILPPPLCDSHRPRTWRQIYSLTAVNKSLARIRMVGYNQKLDVYGALTVMAVSSGYCLGSSNWVIDSMYEKVAYVSGSSTLTTHPRPMDQAALKNANVLILTGLTQTPTANPDSMLGELCMTVASTVRVGGNVLIPCYPSGVVYDLFECLSGHLDSVGMSTVPMFFISPVADTSLAYSNIFAEWLSTVKQNKVYLPEEPFPHALLSRTGRLKHFKHIHTEGFSTDYRQPCVVFCGHPSLRFGDAVHFVELWGSNALNTIIFTEPDFPYLEALAPYQPLMIKTVHCPIDTSLNFTQANKLIRELKPGTLVLPECYLQPPFIAPNRPDLVVDTDRPVIVFKRDDVLSLPLKRKLSPAEISTSLTEKLHPNEVRSGVSLVTMTGQLVAGDNKYTIQARSSSGKKRLRVADDFASIKPDSYTWGSLNVEEFIQKISQEGITDAKVEKGASGYIIHLPQEDSLIQVDESSTHIICDGDEVLRQKLRNVLLQCLNKF
ncbi:integrator complex subunit 9 [Bacillus rossius redtenbacheri]|uniref:integrator complex subunit 9 n=1 Tax=Bacillus rossius redtenbacheri TaxID=93214 RepID=UPI002FDCA39F